MQQSMRIERLRSEQPKTILTMYIQGFLIMLKATLITKETHQQLTFLV